ncbi:hypothetical protein HC928_24880 [bacterium]|nr:hypothetical protein [bacterium]
MPLCDQAVAENEVGRFPGHAVSNILLSESRFPIAFLLEKPDFDRRLH